MQFLIRELTLIIPDVPFTYFDRNQAFESYRIGTDICIDRTVPVTYVIRCDDRGFEYRSIKIQWKKNQHIVVGKGETSIRRDIFSERSGYEILNPYVVNPPVLQLNSPYWQAIYNLSISTVTFNSSVLATTLSPTLTSQELRSMAVNAVLGEWSCEYSNIYGTDTATSRIKECGMLLQI